MQYPFCVQNDTVRLYRFQAVYPDDAGGGTPAVELLLTREEAEGRAAQGAEVTELDVSGFMWLEGVRVASVEQARAICELGEAAYRARLAETAQKSPDQLRADVDFISAMTGVELV